MQRFVVSTNGVPERDRFSYWRDEFGETMAGVTDERSDDPDIPFEASVVGSISRSLQRFRCQACGHPVFRRERDIARHGYEDRIGVYREIGGSSWIRRGGREFVTRPGDLIIADPTVPFEIQALRSYDHEMWSFPRLLIDPHLAATQRPRSLHLPNRPGVNSLVLGYLDMLGGQLDSLHDDEVDTVADNFCRLLAVACGASVVEQQDAIRGARLAEAQRYINLHLSEPGLTPEKTAEALRISVRQLHFLFEPSGTSFARYVTRRRLEECRTAIMNPLGDRSVTDIALAWGFSSLETFHRTFRRAFDATPGELRRNAKRSS